MRDLVTNALELRPELVQPSDDPAAALKVCLAASDLIRRAGQATVFARIVLGRQLLVIQQKQLWRHYRVGENPNVLCMNWDEWMSRGFEHEVGMSRDIGYAALAMAKSPVFSKMPDEQAKQFSSLSNAIELVRVVNRRGGKVSEDLVQKAIDLPVREFRRATGAPEKVPVATLVDGKDRADKLEQIFNFMKGAEVHAIEAFAEALEWARQRSGDSATDSLTAIHNWVKFQIQQEEPGWEP